MGIFDIFKKRQKAFPQRSLNDLKEITRILFIDDKSFNFPTQLKNLDGWKHVVTIKDVTSITQPELAEAHIVFVDVQGVGKILGFHDEGQGLICAIRQEYPAKKIIMYSAESNGQVDGFHPAANLVDHRLRKGSPRTEFNSIITQYAKEIFCLDYCVSHIQDVIQRELGLSISEEDIKKNILQLYNKGNSDRESILSVFNLQNLGSAADIITLLLTIA